MKKSVTTPRFDKDYDSFSNIERHDVKEIKKVIELAPIPPNNSKWKELKQFKKNYPDGIVCAHSINHWDHMVYELNMTTGEITFTNCRGHKYRGKSYAEELSECLTTIKSKCRTTGQKLAFNRLLNTFKFRNEEN